MQLDWFTTAAQIVNFLILVALLKRFLYGPIIRAMDAREAHISTQVEAAQAQLAQAERQAIHYQEQLQTLNETRETLLTQAEEAAEAQRQRLIDQARQEVQELQARWRQTLKEEQTAFLHELREQAGLHVMTVARHAFEDLANRELEATVIQVFLDRLRAFGDEARRAFDTETVDPPMEVVIRSAFPIPAETQSSLIQAVHDHLADGAQVQFSVSLPLICGIELEVQGRKLAWHLAYYVDQLEEQFAALLGTDGQSTTAIAL